MEFMDCTLHVLSGQFCGSSCNNDKKGGGALDCFPPHMYTVP